MRGRAVRVCPVRLRGCVPADQRTHHVDQPGHLLLEDGLRHSAGLAHSRDLLEVLHDALRRVLVATPPEVREDLQLLGAKDLVLQWIVPIRRIGRVRGRLGHEQPRLHIGDSDLLDVGLELFRRLVLEQDHGADHGGPEAEQIVLGVRHPLPVPEAVHGEAVDLLDPDLEVRGCAQLVELVRRVDLAEEPAHLVVAIVVLQPHLGSKQARGSLHHAGQQCVAVLLLLEEGAPQGGQHHQGHQGQLGALGKLRAAAPGVEVEEQLRDALVPEHVPAVGHHDGALLIRRLVRDRAHEVEGQAVARQLQDLLHQPPLVVLVRNSNGAAHELLQGLERYGEDGRQRCVPEAQRRAAEARHREAHGRLHVSGEVRVNLQAEDPVQRRGLQKLTDPVCHVLVLRSLEPRELDDPAQEAHDGRHRHGGAAVEVGAVLCEIVEKEGPHLFLLPVRHRRPVRRDELRQGRRREDQRVGVRGMGQHELQLWHALWVLRQRQQRLVRLRALRL
mmetsp:Transcript_23722/g.67590  ORF Transcript_23722/g.67590 Transcript_23722/m.67590 type:complete len:502 (+) Transcript_23722:1778-3283(+)